MHASKETMIGRVKATIINGHIIKFEAPANVEMQLEDGLLMLAFMQQEFGDRPFASIVDKSQSYSLSPDMIAKGRDMVVGDKSIQLKAIAYLASTPMAIDASRLEMSMLTNMMLTQLCTDENEAVEWLEGVLAE